MKKNEEIAFNSESELYNRLRPALRSKKKALIKNGFKYLNEKDIYDYMRSNKWADSVGLELCDMVDDILNTDNKLIIADYHNKYMSKKDIVEDIFDLPKLKS